MTSKTDKIRAALEFKREELWEDLKSYMTHDEFNSLFAVVRIEEALSELDGCVILQERGSYKFTECTDLELLEERQACIITGKIAPYVNGEKK